MTSGETLASVASAIKLLIPTTPQAASGNAYYAVSISGTVLTIRRIDQLTPISASVAVSIPASASTAPITGNTASITYAGTPLDGELWAVTVDGTTYPYISGGSDSIGTVIDALAALIPSASYTVTISATTLTVTSKISPDDDQRVRLGRPRDRRHAGQRHRDGLRLERDGDARRLGRPGRGLDADRRRHAVPGQGGRPATRSPRLPASSRPSYRAAPTT